MPDSPQRALERMMTTIQTDSTPSFGPDDVKRGLSVSLLDDTAALYKVTPSAFGRALGIAERTLKRRRDADPARLSSAESDRLLHAREIYGLTVDAFDGNADAASRWLTSPKVALGNEAPVDQLATRASTQIVEQMLISMTYLMPV